MNPALRCQGSASRVENRPLEAAPSGYFLFASNSACVRSSEPRTRARPSWCPRARASSVPERLPAPFPAGFGFPHPGCSWCGCSDRSFRSGCLDLRRLTLTYPDRRGPGNLSSESTDFLPQTRRAKTGTSSGGTEQSTRGALTLVPALRRAASEVGPARKASCEVRRRPRVTAAREAIAHAGTV